MTPVRALLVDDHPVVRLGLRQALEAGGIAVVGEAATAVDGRDLAIATTPDVALVDLDLPDASGIEVIRQVRSRNSGIACIVFTSSCSRDAFFQSMSAGAAGFLLKESATSQVIGAVRRVAGGASLMCPELLDDLRSRTAARVEDVLLAQFTPQEERILDLVSLGHTNREIAIQLRLAEKTVRNYVSTMLGKAGMRNRTQLAAAVARARNAQAGGDHRPSRHMHAPPPHLRHPVLARPRRVGVPVVGRPRVPALHH